MPERESRPTATNGDPASVSVPTKNTPIVAPITLNHPKAIAPAYAVFVMRTRVMKADVDAVVADRLAEFEVHRVALTPDQVRMYGLPLLDSRWSFAEQSRRLIAAKAYTEHDGGEDR